MSKDYNQGRIRHHIEAADYHADRSHDEANTEYHKEKETYHRNMAAKLEKESKKSMHQKVICKFCKSIISNCRCASPSKITTEGVCDVCAAAAHQKAAQVFKPDEQCECGMAFAEHKAGKFRHDFKPAKKDLGPIGTNITTGPVY